MGLFIAFAAAWLSIVMWHDHIPWPVQMAVYVYLGGLWMSLGHEMLHGHPTPWRPVNFALAFPPLSLWLPFARYRALHLKHHDSDLTSPEDDPESFYVPPVRWNEAGPVRRRYLLFLRTIAGRLTIGVPRGILRFWRREFRLASDGGVAVWWIVHVLAVTALGVWLFGVMDVNPVVYIVGFCLGGTACTQLRSFAEHAAVKEGTRSAVVKASPPVALLFLNNNLHHTHHEKPGVAWYRLPALHRRMGSDEVAAGGAGLWTGGYFQIVRVHLFKPFCQPDHPLSPGARPHGSRGLR